MIAFARTCLAVAATLLLVNAPVRAQEQPNLIIVLDGSGSMWGQVDGRTKIDLARDALSQVLSEATTDMQIGMIAYGHRVRGQCTDIEVMVPNGPRGRQRARHSGRGRPDQPAGHDAADRVRPAGGAAAPFFRTGGHGRAAHRRGGKLRRRPLCARADAGTTGHRLHRPRGRVRHDRCGPAHGVVPRRRDGRPVPLRRTMPTTSARALRETIIAAPQPDPGPTLRNGQHHAPRHRGWCADQRAPDRPLRRAANPRRHRAARAARDAGPTGDGHGGVPARPLHRLYPPRHRRRHARRPSGHARGAGGHRPPCHRPSSSARACV